MRILILDDQRAARRVLRSLLEGVEGLSFEETGSIEDAQRLCREQRFDAFLVDIHLSDNRLERGGIRFVEFTRQHGLGPAVIVTMSTEMQDLREAMRAGAVDYVMKDQLSADLIVPIIRELRDKLQLQRSNQELRARLSSEGGLAALVGHSAPMERLRGVVRRLADADATVLIRGPNGSGKELVARALHQSGRRAEQPFVAVNCAAIAPSLVESEIFGHERGAFTHAVVRRIGCLEEAGGGTIFLDEVAELSPELQAKLLRVLEDRRFRRVGGNEDLLLRARVVAATHQDLEARIQAGRFREDLYYRLNVLAVDVPTLSARREDIPALVNHMTRHLGRPLRFTEDALAWLARRQWPGNVRELRNALERVVLLADGDEITAEVLAALAPPRREDGRDDAQELDRLARRFLALDTRGSKLDLMEEAMVRVAMQAAGDNKSRAAELLQIDRRALDRRWQRLRPEREGREGRDPDKSGRHEDDPPED